MTTQMDSLFAVCNLVGQSINGWTVIDKIPEPDSSKGETGGNFSICYIVKKNMVECFMKVLDIRACMLRKPPLGRTQLEEMAKATNEFNYEMKLSEHCSSNGVKNVIQFIEGGDANIPGFAFPTVSYIIYEKADGNIRQTLDLSTKLVFSEKLKSLALKLKSLHNITLGVYQLHKVEVSHQDLKPSNVLTIGENSKIGDLGRSLCLDPNVNCPYPLVGFNGDWTYAPPEAFFNYSVSDEKERLYQMDNYMIGSIVVYYITGVSFNVLLEYHLPYSMRAMRQSGMSYIDAKPYLIDAYSNALSMFEKEIPLEEVQERLVKIVEYLCNPDPIKRGHPKNILATNRTKNFDLERTISELDLLRRKAEIDLLKK